MVNGASWQDPPFTIHYSQFTNWEEGRMVRSGLILGGLALLVSAGATLISPVCAPCVAIFLGLGAGYLASAFEKPTTSASTSKAGAISGAIAGAGAILGQIVGAIINSTLVGPENLQAIYEKLGVPTSGMNLAQTYWIGMVGGTACFSVLDVLVMAGFGAVGGLLWWRTAGQR